MKNIVIASRIMLLIYEGKLQIIKKIFLLKWSDTPGSLDYSIRAQKDILWISPADNHDFCQDE
jgi:hypothetical protein